MTNNVKFIATGSLALVVALVLSACNVAQPSANYQTTAAPSYGYGPDVPGGMMGGGHMGGGGMMGGGMMSGGGMMGGYGYNQSAPTAEPTPIGATPIPVDEEIQITALNLRFTPAEITVKPGETVRFVVTNGDPYLHNFGSQDAGIPFLTLPGNTTQTATWTAPKTEGTYTALCTLHPGMTLTLIVKD
jgi:plastocyanin